METALNKNEGTNRICSECTIIPPVDIVEEKERFILYADMPGVAKDHLEVTLDNHELSITGRTESLDRGEPSHADFTASVYKRVFTVTDEIDAAHINASLENGVLSLTLPKSERSKPRKIEIRTN